MARDWASTQCDFITYAGTVCTSASRESAWLNKCAKCMHECTREFRHASRCTFRCMVKGHRCTQTLTFHLRLILGQTPLLLPQLPMRRHHFWCLKTRPSLRRYFLNFTWSCSLTVSQSPQCPPRLGGLWPLTPDPLGLAVLQLQRAYWHQCRSAMLSVDVSPADVSMESPGFLVWLLIHRWAGLKRGQRGNRAKKGILVNRYTWQGDKRGHARQIYSDQNQRMKESEEIG